MNPWLQNPAFVAYAITCLLLSLNLLGLWILSGSTRAKTGVAINPEDAARYKAALADADPPGVARVLRAHRNAEACIYPFLILGLVYVLAGGPAGRVEWIFGVFTAARLLHSFFYIKGQQPWRSIAFGVGALATLVLMACIAWLLIR